MSNYLRPGGTHDGLERLRSELAIAEQTLRNVMTDPSLLRSLAHDAASFAQLWRGLKAAQAETDFLRAILSGIER